MVSMIKLKKKFLPNKIISTIFLVAFYLYSRLIHLTIMPVFCDEAIYIRWSQIIKNIDTMRFIPMSDGKQPLFMWLMVPFFKFISDPLVAGRFISVLSGFGIIIALFCIYYFFIEKNFYRSLIPVIIYILLPFTFFFDRLSTADNLLSMFGIWSLLFSLLLAKHPRFDLSFILGIVLGLAWLTRSPEFSK